jgi:hypothetical protein
MFTDHHTSRKLGASFRVELFNWRFYNAMQNTYFAFLSRGIFLCIETNKLTLTQLPVYCILSFLKCNTKSFLCV